MVDISSFKASDFRALARQRLQEHVVKLSLVMILTTIISSIISFLVAEVVPSISLTLVVALFISSMLQFGQRVIFTRRFREQPYAVTDLFQWNMMLKCVGVTLLKGLIVVAPYILGVCGLVFATTPFHSRDSVYGVIWVSTLITAVMYIVVALFYSMTEYLWVDQPELGVVQALRESRVRMKGHRWAFFTLSLSFIGWFLLSIFAASVLISILRNWFSASIMTDVTSIVTQFVAAPVMVYMSLAHIAFFEALSGRNLLTDDSSATGGAGVPVEPTDAEDHAYEIPVDPEIRPSEGSDTSDDRQA